MGPTYIPEYMCMVYIHMHMHPGQAGYITYMYVSVIRRRKSCLMLRPISGRLHHKD